MIQTLTITPTLSSGFGFARTLSRVMAGLFVIALLFNLATTLVAVLFGFIHETPSGVGLGVGVAERVTVSFKSLTPAQAFGAALGLEIFALPRALAMYHFVRLFLSFGKGEVFAARPIAHLRAAGLWLTASFFTSIAAVWVLHSSGSLMPQGGAMLQFPAAVIGMAIIFRSVLFAGVPVIIAAHVMDEARRIAADHAEIV